MKYRKEKEKKRTLENDLLKVMADLYIIFGCPVIITFRASRQGISLLKVNRTDFDDNEDDEYGITEPSRIDAGLRERPYRRPHYVG